MPLVPFRRRRQASRVTNPNALTASGVRVHRVDADHYRRLVAAWQTRSFAYYDLLGEIKYAAQFYSRALAQLRLYAAEINEDGDTIETTNPAVVDAVERIRDPGGGRTNLLGAYGRLMFLVGEAYLLVTRDSETQVEQWEMLSTDEIRVQSGIYQRFKAPQLMVENLHDAGDDQWEPLDSDEAVVYRLWQRHPRYSALADATMQGVLDLCEELVLLTQAVRARARSRLAGPGLLLFDDKIAPVPLEPSPDEDPDDDPFVRDLTEAMMAPIQNEGTPSAVVPLTVRVSVPDDKTLTDMVYHLQIIDPLQLYPEVGLREECIKRIAIGLDMPPEILLGLMDANHWSGWMIDEQTWKHHLQPKAQQLVDDLTSAYLQPSLRAAGIADWEKYLIAYDATAIINHPDRTKDAKELWDRQAISDESLRDAAGFDEDDAPDEDEWLKRVGVHIRDGSMAAYGIPSLKSGGIEPQAGEVETGQASNTSGEGGAQTPADVQPAPPATPTADQRQTPPVPGDVVGSMNGHSQLDVTRVLAAADITILRARQAVGNRLRSLARKDKEALALIDGVNAIDVAAVLGRDRVRALKAPNEKALVAGCRDILSDALRGWGITDEGIVDLVAQHVEQHAIRTLYQRNPPQLPPSFTTYLLGLFAKTRV